MTVQLIGNSMHIDQSFSVKSLQEIFDAENRRGINVEKLFSTDFAMSKHFVEELKKINKKIRHTQDRDERQHLYVERDEIKKQRNKAIDDVLDKVSKSITNTKDIVLERGQVYGKQSYKLEDTIDNFFISKKLQNNISKLYTIKQNSRHNILKELIDILNNNFPKIVVRADISAFYESIPQKKMRDKIHIDNLLSMKSIYLINNILDSYNNITLQVNPSTAFGLPRGVGISAYLAELYARKIDVTINTHKELVYYGRYVDDIIAVFIPQSIKGLKPEIYQKFIEDTISTEGLSHNIGKTKYYSLVDGLRTILTEDRSNGNIITSKENGINFLGYNIGTLLCKEGNSNKLNESLYLQLSDRKIIKYKNRLRLIFKCYNDSCNKDKLAFKLLEARVKYLTSNTQLYNNKSEVFVGIYYNSPLITDPNSLLALQNSLKYYIYRANISNEQKDKLLSYSFISGFNNKIFFKIPLVNKKYRNYNCTKSDSVNQSNSGIIAFGLERIITAWKHEEKQ